MDSTQVVSTPLALPGEQSWSSPRMSVQTQPVHANDKELVSSMKVGNPVAAFELDRRWRARLVSLARSVLGDDHLAEDAAQLALWRVHLHIHLYDDSRPFERWILKIAGNCARDLKRRRKVQPKTVDDCLLRDAAEVPDPGKRFCIEPEEVEVLRACLEQLHERDRTVVSLFASGFSLRDIGKVLDRPKSTVQAWLNRALTMLRQSMSMSGVGLAV